MFIKSGAQPGELQPSCQKEVANRFVKLQITKHTPPLPLCLPSGEFPAGKEVLSPGGPPTSEGQACKPLRMCVTMALEVTTNCPVLSGKLSPALCPFPKLPANHSNWEKQLQKLEGGGELFLESGSLGYK